MTQIKICGLRDVETLDAALDAGADYIGLVFYEPSPRHVDFAQAADLARRAHGRARVVALVVDPDDDVLTELTSNLQTDAIQFHGHEKPERIEAFRARYVGEIWKAVPVATGEDIDRARLYSPVVDQLLFDAKPAADDTRPGGNGRRFDWSLVSGLDLGLPFVLSGGLDPDNVAEAIRISRAPMVDVSSGVESAPGIKDPDRIAAFVRAVRDTSERPSS